MLPYFERFIGAYPTVFDLAKAELHDVLLNWEGLGYYSRARNLHDAARDVVELHGGRIPDSLEDIRKLKGVGPYTSAAVLSIAYGKPHAVVDGNVIRLITRYLGMTGDIRRADTLRSIHDFVSRQIDMDSPGDYNQAMMELGSRICKPSKPLCSDCPLEASCVALHSLTTEKIPYKPRKTPVPHFDVVVGCIFNDAGDILITKRPENAMLGGLWEFPGGKRETGETLVGTLHRELDEELGIEVEIIGRVSKIKHAYSHFKISLHGYICKQVGGRTIVSGTNIRWVKLDELTNYPFPKANRNLIDYLMKSVHQNF